eukprot:m.1037920 g.1037920  ORF g.1037920 m.1037920 type:complete len:599 (-) comp24146_c1_seq6:2586-4382(-)
MFLVANQHWVRWIILSYLVTVAVVCGVVVPVVHDGSTHGAIVTGAGSNTMAWKCDVFPLEGFAGRDPIAVGSFDDTILKTGWGTLNITTNTQVLSHQNETSPQKRMFAAGCLESYFTHTRMMQYWKNYAKMEYGSTAQPSRALLTFMSSQLTFARNLVASDPGADSAHGLRLLLAQFDGLATGFDKYATDSEKRWLPDALHVYLLNSVGDLETLNGLFKDQDGASSSLPQYNINSERRVLPEVSPLSRLDCSALIQVVTDPATGLPQDIFAGHTTWRAFYAMLRIYKTYAFVDYPASVVSIASSPGLLHSKDDFYATPSLVVMETTNGIFNTSLYTNNIKPQTLLSWQRAMVATAFAQNGSHWVALFSAYNSGTYNNQWMVVDTTLFHKHNSLPTHDLLWIAEQIPGRVRAGDVTSVLRTQGYWPSYNIPYFADIFNASGYQELVKREGPSATYDECPRALIFRRNVSTHTATSMADFKKLMRYNNFANDPICQKPGYSGGSCAISARGDLSEKGETIGADVRVARGTSAFGGVDAKVTAASMMDRALAKVEVHAACGPTHDQQPVFTWESAAYVNVSHEGLPPAFAFDFVPMRYPSR